MSLVSVSIVQMSRLQTPTARMSCPNEMGLEEFFQVVKLPRRTLQHEPSQRPSTRELLEDLDSSPWHDEWCIRHVIGDRFGCHLGTPGPSGNINARTRRAPACKHDMVLYTATLLSCLSIPSSACQRASQGRKTRMFFELQAGYTFT